MTVVDKETPGKRKNQLPGAEVKQTTLYESGLPTMVTPKNGSAAADESCKIFSVMTKEDSSLKNLQYKAIIKEPRTGCKDIWNAHMAKGAKFCAHDIPLCPTTAKGIPNDIITWEEAKAIYKEHIAKKDYNFKDNAFVCFYIDDCKFDGPRGIWHDYKQALKVLRHFAGVITPDFSTYQDFPEPIKLYATYRMRLYGYWLGVNELEVINNVRWGTPETWHYCFEGIPAHSIVAIGTVGGSPRKLIDRKRFEDGLYKMVEVLKPHMIIVYGSANYECFEKLKEQGITIVSFQSKTAKAFDGRKSDE